MTILEFITNFEKFLIRKLNAVIVDTDISEKSVVDLVKFLRLEEHRKIRDLTSRIISGFENDLEDFASRKCGEEFRQSGYSYKELLQRPEIVQEIKLLEDKDPEIALDEIIKKAFFYSKYKILLESNDIIEQAFFQYIEETKK
ncbi:hypothetical protein HOK00_08570 [bacterium]|jgi:hypothetical protein|nr:hypothetical protein [bacterium]